MTIAVFVGAIALVGILQAIHPVGYAYAFSKYYGYNRDSDRLLW
jgi:hypothetical protein